MPPQPLRPLFWRSLLTAALLGAALLALGRGLGPWLAGYDGWVCRPGDFHVSEGVALLHGLPDARVSFSMPGFSLPHAWLCGHAGASLQMLLRGLGLLAACALVFALGCGLHSPVCGAAAVLFYALSLDPVALGSDRWLYTLFVLLTACAMAWHARRPDVRRAAAVGLAVGLSLLVLSPLALLPPVLILYERARRRAPWRELLPLALVPVLLLLPWLLMNWSVHHRFILLEDGRARNNIIMGALGFVLTGGAGQEEALRAVPFENSALWWALRQVLCHPLTYLAACAKRLLFAASLQSLLFSAGLAAAWLLRRGPGARPLLLLAATFIGAHCLTAVELKSFDPAWPLLAVLAAGAAFSRSSPAPRRPGPLAAGLALAAAAPLVLLSLWALSLVWVYPARAARAAAGEDSCVLGERGSRLLAEGRAKEAAADLSRALALAPRRLEWRMRYAWARLAEGRSGARPWLELRFEPAMQASFGTFWQSFRVVFALAGGRPDEARAALCLGQDAPGPAERSFTAMLACWPQPLRGRLEGRLAGLLAEGPCRGLRPQRLWLEEARQALASRWPASAGPILERAGRLPLDAEEACLLAGLYSDSGAPGRAAVAVARVFQAGPPAPQALRRGLDVLRRRVRRRPEEIGLLLSWADAARAGGAADAARPALAAVLDEGRPREAAVLLDIAEAAAAVGGRATALRALDAAVRGSLPMEPARRAARLYGELGRRAQAGAVLERLLGQSRLDAPSLARIAVDYQGLGDYRKALSILEGLVRAEPGNARRLADRGVARMLLGRPQAAAEDWRRALSLDPGFLSATLSLGSFHAAAGRRGEALALYEKALLQPAGREPGTRALLDRIRGERDRLLSSGR